MTSEDYAKRDRHVLAAMPAKLRLAQLTAPKDI